MDEILKLHRALGWLYAGLSLVALSVGIADAQELVLRHVDVAIMGTDLKISVLGDDPELLDRAMAAAITEMRRVEDLMTDWRASPLEDLNKSAGTGPAKVPAELAQIIGRAIELHKLTDGAFDISFASAGRLWDFKRDHPRLPTDAEIKEALAFVDASRIKIDAVAGEIELPAQMRIGLGGIAKGYGVDRAMSVLMAQGVEHAMVNAGGDLKVLGRKFDQPWEIAIKHPRDRERVLALLKLSNSCLVTSGDYERFFEKDGKRYHHILDPRTGYPATGCISVSVVGPNAELADALATAVCVLPPDRGLALIEKLPRIEALLVTMSGEVLVSSGLKDVVAESEP
ncbi:MAG: FAD:protein FMN transferase [Verrucomicrobia bacterium]|nr:FAD:protein FMN transferase [Verrucomicrobiota bacterium]MDA1087116.1 FAD:protein FMN transferase [Verrucomicrobiota bacterium]